MAELGSTTIICNDDIESIFETYYKAGMTDGLPIIPPTRERVKVMISGVDRVPSDVVAVLPPKMGDATVEKIAINSVMAGCLPSYMPVLIAAVEAIADPLFNCRGHQTTTSTIAIMLIINGPVRQKLDINSSWGVFGPGWRANATIGRAISLIMRNIGGAIPGEVSQSVLGHPGRYSMCIAEREEISPWEPLHVDRGFKREDSTVTVFASNEYVSLEHPGPATAEWLLADLAGSMHLTTYPTWPSWNKSERCVIMCPDYAAILSREGYSKQDVKRYFYEHTLDIPTYFFAKETLERIIKQDKGELNVYQDRKAMIQKGLIKPDQTQLTPKGVALTARPDQWMIIVAGGDGRINGAFMRPWGDSWAVTKRINLKD